MTLIIFILISNLFAIPSTVSLPYTESFETGLGDWIQDNTDDANWTINSGSTPSAHTSPMAAHDGSYYIYLESSGPNNPDKNASIVAYFDFSSTTIPTLSFWYHMYGANMGTLHMDVSAGCDTFVNDVIPSITDNRDAWMQKVIDLKAYAEQSCVAIRFRGTTGSSYLSDMAIDDLHIYELMDILDETTVTYCRENPNNCGIKPNVVVIPMY